MFYRRRTAAGRACVCDSWSFTYESQYNDDKTEMYLLRVAAKIFLRVRRCINRTYEQLDSFNYRVNNVMYNVEKYVGTYIIGDYNVKIL